MVVVVGGLIRKVECQGIFRNEAAPYGKSNFQSTL